MIDKKDDGLELLEALVDRFGYEILVAGEGPRKLFLLEFVPLPSGPGAPFEFSFKPERAWVVEQSMVADHETDRLAVLYAFALDISSLTPALRGETH